MNNKQYSPLLQDNDSANLRAELEKYLINWKWFVLGIFISLLGAFLYLRYSTPLYSASATILIKNDKKGGLSDELAAFGDLGIVGGSSKNIDNEIEILKSENFQFSLSSG
ncbi:MAG: Wzz/FepE/Etk N-terminal domain-containing protein, partial [Flavobacteriaceae bacterium]